MGQHLSSGKSLGQHRGPLSLFWEWVSQSKVIPEDSEPVINLQSPPPYKEACPDLVNEDICLRAARRNHQHSRLLRLPESLLVAIMERLDTDDILRLRHTSRIFMRLFSQSKEFRHLHLTTHEDKNPRQQLARVWAVPQKSIYISKDGRGRLPPLCDTCESIKKDKNRKNDVPFLYCSGCRAEHQAFYFSLQQRRGSNDDERICLGCEHSFSLCQHMSVTWDALNRLADRSDGKTVVCNNAQHTDASGCSHVRRDGPESACCHDDKPQLEAWRDNGDILLKISASFHVLFRSTSSKNGRVRSMSFLKHVLWTLLRYLGHKKGSGVFWGIICHDEQGEQRKWDFLKPFDPNICSCLDWGAQASPGPPVIEWRLSPNPTRAWRKKSRIGLLHRRR